MKIFMFALESPRKIQHPPAKPNPNSFSPLILHDKSGELKAVMGQGMPTERHHDFGNLYIQFEIEFPSTNWTDIAKIEQLRTILPPATELPALPKGAHVEEVSLTEMDPRQRARAEQGHMDDEEEGGHGGVQCAQQ